MESHIAQRPNQFQKPNVLKLVYADGVSPVTHARFKVVALGQASVPASDLQDDFEAWVSKTSGIGEIWLASPELIQGMDILQQVVKRENPTLNRWEYVPPSGAALVAPYGAARLPVVPLVVRVDDDAVAAPTLELPLRSAMVVTRSWRPPIAELNGRPFSDAAAFVRQLCQRFRAMDSDRSQVSLKLTRCGAAPAYYFETAWGQLGLQLGTTRSDYLGVFSAADKKKFRGLRQHVGFDVMRKLIPGGTVRSGNLAALYLEQLNQLAKLAPLAAIELSNAKLVSLIQRVTTGIGMSPDAKPIKTPAEDVALVGAMLFIIGAISRGYLWGTLDSQVVGNNQQFTAAVGTTTSCSENQFQSYCELMRP